MHNNNSKWVHPNKCMHACMHAFILCRVCSRLVDLYGASNARRFILAKAAWMFAVVSNIGAPHLEVS